MAALWGSKEEEESPSAVSSLFLPLSLSVAASRLSAHTVQSAVLRPRFFHFLKGQIVHFEIWLTCFRYDIRPLFYTQPRAHFLVFTASFKHQQLSFSRPFVCATCAYRHIALPKQRTGEI